MEGVSFFAILLLSILGFLICALLVRSIFRIDTQIKNQEATIFLLIKLWEKQGADPQQVELFKKKYKVSYK